MESGHLHPVDPPLPRPEPRVERGFGGGCHDRRFSDRCPDPRLEGPIPFDTLLRRLNGEEREVPAKPHLRLEPFRARPVEPPPEGRRAPRDAEPDYARTAAKLGDVSPVAPDVLARRLQIVYAIEVPIPAGRLIRLYA